MSETEITVQEVRDALDAYGIEYELSDAQIQMLINIKTEELQSSICVHIGPMIDSYEDWDFSGDRFFLPYYPVINLMSVKVNNTVVLDCKYKERTGLVKLPTRMSGDLEVVYTYGLRLNNHLKMLIIDMICNSIRIGSSSTTSSSTTTNNISTIREGDVSISYSNSTSDVDKASDSINQRVDWLRNEYAGRLRLL